MTKLNQVSFEWPYPIEYGKEEHLETDVLVLGGGIAGCFAAIAAAKKGARVVLLEKGATIRSGAAGSGCDHWESAATNPCSKVTPEELTDAMIRAHGGYNNGISHYIECREGYDRLLDLERMGAKIRDTEDAFSGAEFRDEKTKLLFAYDYQNRFTLRVWGTTFKPALYAECLRRGVRIMDRIMATSLLREKRGPEKHITGAMGIGCRTGKFVVVRAGATVLAMSRPTRLWLFSTGLPGISEFRPPQCTGDGHAMAWRAGAAFAMMEKSIKAEWSGERSFPPYSTGNNHNTWYACSMVDADGRKIPWIDRDGNILKTVSQRYRPSPGQKFYLKGGGEPEIACYDFQGPDTLAVDELLKQGYKLPFYADLTDMPEHEHRVIWGMMIGQEGKTKIPILQNYTAAGFDPATDLLQSYGEGWKSGAFLPQERQFFGIPGGLFHDWTLKTNLEGLYAAGDQLFASNCLGHAAATGHYAGRYAAAYGLSTSDTVPEKAQVASEKERVYRPMQRTDGIGWKELNAAVTRLMQHHCGAVKSDILLQAGLDKLRSLERNEAALLMARNPHELMRSLEVLSVLTNAELVLQSSLGRKAGSPYLHFQRSDYPQTDPPEWRIFVTVKRRDDEVTVEKIPLNYYGSLKEKYESINQAYLEEQSDA